jgi:hypothetical protein
MPHKIQRLGWIPDLPDHRDQLYSAPVTALQSLPSRVNLTPHCPPVYDQGQLGSCTANSIGAAVEFEQMKQKLASVFVPSRLFIYFNERSMEGTVDSDSGAQIRDGIKSVAKQGVCPEKYGRTSSRNSGPDLRRNPMSRRSNIGSCYINGWSLHSISSAAVWLRVIPSCSASPFMKALNRRRSRSPATFRCPARWSKPWAAMPSWLSASMIRSNGLSPAIRGDRNGG